MGTGYVDGGYWPGRGNATGNSLAETGHWLRADETLDIQIGFDLDRPLAAGYCLMRLNESGPSRVMPLPLIREWGRTL
jgi:hypothetical protein